MADEKEKIEVEVTDKVSPEAARKLRDIAKAARDSDNAVIKLQKAVDAHALSTQKLATELQKTNSAYLNSEAALNRAVAAEVRANAETTKLAVAQTAAATSAQRLANEQSRSAIAAQQLATAQQQTALSTQKIATEQQRTASAAQILAVNQQKVATAFITGAAANQRYVTETQRTVFVQHQAAGAAQRLATETNRTAREAANAAAASDRATLASLRLAQAQGRVAGATSATAQAFAGWARQLLVVGTVVQLTRALVGLSDQYTTLQNKLKIVTDSEEQQAVLTRRIFDLANQTRSPVQDVATSFARLDNSLILLGKSQTDTLRLQRTLNELFTIGGSTTSEQSAALLQLSQAFNANKLQGDEFRSLMENMPRQVRTAIAAALNVNEANLKKLSSEGKITADVLFRAFSSLDKFADSKFAETVPTISASFVKLKNAVIEVIGEVNKATGTSSKIASALTFVSDQLRQIGQAYVVFKTTTGAVFNFVLSASEQIGIAIKNFFIDTYNGILQYAENSVNALLGTLNKIRSTLGLSQFSLVNFEGIKKEGETQFKTMGQLWAEALKKSMKESGFDDLVAGFAGDDKLRGKGPNTTGADDFTARDVEALKSAIASLDLSLNKTTRSDLERDGNKIASETNRELKENNNQLSKVVTIQSQVAKAAQQLYDATVGRREAFSTRATAISREARNNPSFTSADKASAANDLARDAGIDTTGTSLDIEVRLNSYKTMYQQIDEMRQKDLLSEKQAADLRGKVAEQERFTRLENTHKMLDGLSSLMGAGNEKLFKIGKAAAIANAVLSYKEAILNAYATKPWYVGLAQGIAATVSLGQQIASLKSTEYKSGYMSGGFTGNGSTNEVAGVVHGQEWVMNAQATNRIGVANLSALQSGAASVVRNGRQTATAPNITILNYGTSKNFEVQPLSASEVRIIARDEARQQVASEAPKAVASELSNPNSVMSKSVNRNLNASRKR